MLYLAPACVQPVSMQFSRGLWQSFQQLEAICFPEIFLQYFWQFAIDWIVQLKCNLFIQINENERWKKIIQQHQTFIKLWWLEEKKNFHMYPDLFSIGQRGFLYKWLVREIVELSWPLALNTWFQTCHWSMVLLWIRCDQWWRFGGSCVRQEMPPCFISRGKPDIR